MSKLVMTVMALAMTLLCCTLMTAADSIAGSGKNPPTTGSGLYTRAA
jgi:hypothetical protein